jgi:hypothetical protein
MMTESRNRRLRRNVPDPAQGYLEAPVEERLEAAAQSVA